MSNKEIQRKRMLTYFIEAAKKIIEEDGLQAVTIRKVADIAGYNSATLYNYFENLNHLIFFASMKYLNEYAESLLSFTVNSKNSLERYLNVWKCFCYHSFNRPEIYYNIFFGEFSNTKLDVSIRTYYSIFPEELSEEARRVFPMLLEDDFNVRDLGYLMPAVSEGLIKEEDSEEISEMCVLIYEGMLSRMLKEPKPYSIDYAVDKTMKHISKAIQYYTKYEI
jgi:AcrR family transcriptional regulator